MLDNLIDVAGMHVAPDEAERVMRMLRWLRMRSHLSRLPASADEAARVFRIYNATDRLDPWPACRIGTAAWELLRRAERFLWKPSDETTAKAVAACLLAWNEEG